MRIMSLILIIVGTVLGVAYPWAVENFAGGEIDSRRVFDRGGAFQPVEVSLDPGDAPVRVLVDLKAIGQFYTSGSQTALTITVNKNGQTVMAEELAFVHTTPREDSPQTADLIYRDSPGLIDPVSSGTYTFTVGEGDADTLEISSVDLILRRNALAFDPKLQTIGFVLMGIGFATFLRSFIVRGVRKKKAKPAGPKWGRG